MNNSSGNVTGLVFLWIFIISYTVFYLICRIKIFKKARKLGWAAIVPIYSTLVLLEILGRPWWWFLLIWFIPIADFILSIIMIFDLAKVFGKGIGFGFGLLFLNFIFIPLLAFGNARYFGPIAGQTY